MISERGAGEVITFYSYKGGTGRTMALANAGVLLARQTRQRVLMIDWDLEAPGLHRFFYNQLAGGDRSEADLNELPGLIDLFEGAKRQTESSSRLLPSSRGDVWQELSLEPFLLECEVPSLFLLKAGRFDEDYGERVNTFDWEALYGADPSVFRRFAELLASKFRYVLIDSRTGVTDSSGVCTTLLPEKLVVVFTPNRQSLTGVVELVERATTYRQRSDDLRPLLVFPLASRIELSEDDLRKQWRYGDPEQAITGYQSTFEQLFESVYDLSECDLEPYFDDIQIQHSTRFAYGEQIAVLAETGTDRLSLSESFQRFVQALDDSTAPWTFKGERVVPRGNQKVAEVILDRLKERLLGHDRKAALLELRQRTLRAFEATAVLVLLLAAPLVVLLVDTTYGLVTAAISAGLALAIELFIRVERFGKRAAVHRQAAAALERERVFYETGAGPYVNSPDPVVELTERVEEILSGAEERLTESRTLMRA